VTPSLRQTANLKPARSIFDGDSTRKWFEINEVSMDYYNKSSGSLFRLKLFSLPGSAGVKRVDIFEYEDHNVTLSKVKNAGTDPSTFSELRILCTGRIDIDCNLEKDRWHGKNIVIIADSVVIVQNCEFDVSGIDGENFEQSAPNGQNSSCDGEPGKHGRPGQSGGNVLLCCSQITGKNLRIVTNGGRGGDGQSGGNGMDGMDGKDGTSMSADEFKSHFPAIAKFLIHKSNRSIFYALKKLPTFTRKTLWRDDVGSVQTIDEMQTEDAHRRDWFVDGKTEDGRKVIMSFYFSWLPAKRHCLVLHKGGPGQAGQKGGRGGKGGDGGANGYGGQVTVKTLDGSKLETSLIEISNRDGDKGKSGRDGKGGKNGKAGRSAGDHGYVDCMVWFEPLYFHDDNLNVEYHNTVNDKRVWCPYKNKYAEIVRKSPETIKIQQSENEEKNEIEQRYESSVRQNPVTYEILRQEVLSEFYDFVVT
jgi:hypothetical protein